MNLFFRSSLINSFAESSIFIKKGIDKRSFIWYSMLVAARQTAVDVGA